MRFPLSYLLLASTLLPFGLGRDPAPAEFDSLTLRSNPVAVSWASPLAGGPIRALIVAPRYTLGDAAELSRRLDLELYIAPLWTSHRLYAAEEERSALFHDPATATDAADPGKAQERLDRGLQAKPDVIVLGNLDLGVLPPATTQAIQQAVRDGCGLILAHHNHDPVPEAWASFLEGAEPHETDAITRGVGASLTPEWREGLEFVHAGVVGAGRVVDLAYAGARPRYHFLLPVPTRPLEAEPEHVESYYSLAAKACLWAAAREPETWIAGVEEAGPERPEDEEIPPIFPEEYVERIKEGTVRQPYLPYRIRLNRPADANYAVRVQVRQPGRNRREVYETYESEWPLRKGESTYPISLGLGTGRHYLDLWLLDRGRVVDWHTAVVEVEGWPDISDLRFSKGALRPNDSLGISLFVRPPLHEQLYPDRSAVVFVRAVDPLQRVVATAVHNLRQKSGAVRMTLDFADLQAHRVKVEVFVVDTAQYLVTENQEVSEVELGRAAYAHRYFPVWQPVNTREYAAVAAADSFGEYGAAARLHDLADLGVGWLSTSEGTVGSFVATGAGLRPLPVLTSYLPGLSRDGERVPCLTDPRFLTQESDGLEQALRTPGIEAAPVRLLGDGNALALPDDDVCRSETCLAGFRRWLSAEYGTLEALNEAWGTSFASWDDALPAPLEDARASGRFGPWTDFRQYMDSVFASIHSFDRDLISVYDKEVRVGFAAAAQPHLMSGYDWHALISDGLVLAVPSAGTAVEKAFSYRRPDRFVTVRYEGGVGCGSLSYARWLPWHALFHQIGGVWFGDALGRADASPATAALAPDGRPYPGFRAVMDQVIRIRGGIDAVILGAEAEPADFAIYDSSASYYATVADTSFESPEAPADARAAEETWIRILGDLGYTTAFVSPEQVLEGKLEGFKGLVLPLSWALGDDEVDAIEAFQRAGGFLLADVAPARYDRHGAPREEPALAGAFGVGTKGIPMAQGPVEAQVDGGGRKAGVRFDNIFVDASVAAEEAVALSNTDGVPVWLVREGEGSASLLLNHTVSTADIDAATAVLGPLLRDRGIRPRVEIRASKGGFHGRCAVFRYDKATLYGVLRDPLRGDDEERLELRLPEEGRIYNLIDGGSVRRARRVPVRLARGQAALFSHLPYEVEGLTLEVPDELPPGRRLPIYVRVEAEGGIPGTHAVRIEFGPVAGAPLAHYGQTLVCEAGEGATYIPLEAHETPGVYRVVAWDVLSGTSVQALVEITPPPQRDEAPKD